ncbi:hypothetical protein FQZ97_443620 [compost metagenome]
MTLIYHRVMVRPGWWGGPIGTYVPEKRRAPDLFDRSLSVPLRAGTYRRVGGLCCYDLGTG